MNVAEHIKDLENTRAAKVARINEITNKSVEEGRSFDQTEIDEFDDIKADIKQIDGDLVRYSEVQKMSMTTAQPVDENRQEKNDSIQKRGAPAIIKKDDPEEAFEGQKFTRFIIAKAMAKEEMTDPVTYAQKRWGRSHPKFIEQIKADIAGGGSGSGEWGAELVHSDQWMGDFKEFLYAKTVYNQLPLREVPANITIKGQDGAATGYWVGESKAIPASKQDFNEVSLTPQKVAAISVISKELMRDSAPSAEMLVRDGLIEAISQRIDNTFISNAAAVSGVSPAGILNNIAATTSSGTDGDAVANDFKELMYRFTTAFNSGGQYIVMNPTLATGLALLRNALDQYEFPNITEDGGTIFGKPVITGDNVNANYLIMLKPSDIYRIGMGNIEVSMSDAATIEMANNPGADTDTPTAPTQKFVGMFQTESMAIKVVQSMNFARRRESAVAWINDADYGGAIST